MKNNKIKADNLEELIEEILLPMSDVIIMNDRAGRISIFKEGIKFGMIEELIYSKINPNISPLKLKNTDKDKSIYPMVDEYGYQLSHL